MAYNVEDDPEVAEARAANEAAESRRDQAYGKAVQVVGDAAELWLLWVGYQVSLAHSWGMDAQSVNEIKGVARRAAEDLRANPVRLGYPQRDTGQFNPQVDGAWWAVEMATEPTLRQFLTELENRGWPSRKDTLKSYRIEDSTQARRIKDVLAEWVEAERELLDSNEALDGARAASLAQHVHELWGDDAPSGDVGIGVQSSQWS